MAASVTNFERGRIALPKVFQSKCHTSAYVAHPHGAIGSMAFFGTNPRGEFGSCLADGETVWRELGKTIFVPRGNLLYHGFAHGVELR